MKKLRFLGKEPWLYYEPETGEEQLVLSIDFVNNAFYILPYRELEGGSWIEIKGLDKIYQKEIINE